QEAFNRAPRCHRTTGYGLDGPTLQALERLGYAIDSSAAPLLDRRPLGADWRRAPLAPYFPDRQQPDLRGASPVLEVPVTVGFDRPLPEGIGRALVRVPPRLGTRWLLKHPWAPLAHLHALDPIECDAERLRRVADSCVERGLPCLNLPLRSETLWPGESEACPDGRDVDALFGRLDAFLRHAVDTLRAHPRTLSDFAAHYLDEGGAF
ncbi:MAG: hypothetical protein KC620_22505, partial [Myxococcales bacterium]|nr:hypothetical protein [Myxococcales bacterium]